MSEVFVRTKSSHRTEKSLKEILSEQNDNNRLISVSILVGTYKPAEAIPLIRKI